MLSRIDEKPNPRKFEAIRALCQPSQFGPLVFGFTALIAQSPIVFLVRISRVLIVVFAFSAAVLLLFPIFWRTAGWVISGFKNQKT